MENKDFTSIAARQDAVSQNISKMYEQKQGISKAIDDTFGVFNQPDDELEKANKGGAGSRGGKVIGHTKSGKPIYDTASHGGHKDFTSDDHEDAINTHQKVRDAYRNNDKSTDKDKADNDHAYAQQNDHIGHKNRLWHEKQNSGKDSVKKAFETLGIDNPSEDQLEKGKKVPVGTVTNGYKKVGEGKWNKVSEQGMTKKEHQDKSKSDYDNHVTESRYQHKRDLLDQSNKHRQSAHSLDDKDYDDTHVTSQSKSDKIDKSIDPEIGQAFKTLLGEDDLV